MLRYKIKHMTTLDLRNTPERTILDLSRLGLAGAGVLGRYRYAGPHPPLAPHRHPGMVEICYLHRGRQRYEAEGRLYPLRGGDIFVTQPGKRHSTGPDPENRGVLYWLILKIRPAQGHFLGHAEPSGARLARALLDIPQGRFRAPARSRGMLERLLSLARHGGPHALGSLTASCQLTEFLLAVIAAAGKGAKPATAGWLEAVLAQMEGRLDENLQVPDLAAASGLSVSRFKTRFREVMGMAPAEYFLGRRIAAAQQRLTTTRASVTRIAIDLGFSSSQGFATAFRRLTGKTPTEFRAAL